MDYVHAFDGYKFELYQQELSYEEYMILVTKLEDLDFSKCMVNYSDESLVPTDMLLKPLTDIENLLL